MTEADKGHYVKLGTRVVMEPSHPHEGRAGMVRGLPEPPLDMYLIEFDSPHEGNAFAMRRDFLVLDADGEGEADAGDRGRYIRELEDALLIVWEELPAIETLRLRNEYPEMAGFIACIHHSVAHEQAMVRRSVWESTDGR